MAHETGAFRRADRVLAAGLGAALAAACAMTEPTPPPASPVASAAEPEEIAPPPHPARKPAPPAPAVASLPAPEAVPVPEPPPPVDGLGFARLQGLDQAETASILGEPLQRADAPPAQLWRYAGQDCELGVYFYLDLESRKMRVLHYEVRNTDGSDRSQQRCYDELVAARRAEPEGSPDRPR
ncbi:MAG TPA: hypothetical protein VN802_16620 [Stellaceae bacterium]|nr:hypothetical protein [Stellaceae bacterium]